MGRKLGTRLVRAQRCVHFPPSVFSLARRARHETHRWQRVPVRLALLFAAPAGVSLLLRVKRSIVVLDVMISARAWLSLFVYYARARVYVCARARVRPATMPHSILPNNILSPAPAPNS